MGVYRFMHYHRQLNNQLKLRAQVDAVDNQGLTSLMLACLTRDQGIVKYLLENGANVNARNRDGLTALDCARQNTNSEIISLLLAYDAEPSNLALLPETKTEASLLVCPILEGVLSRQTPHLAKVLEGFSPPGR